jgi:hypothetical protein
MASKLSPLLVVLVSLFMLNLAGLLLLPYVPESLKEMFGAQGGGMVQLRSSHVPTEDDVQDMIQEQKQIKKEIIGMTGYW